MKKYISTDEAIERLKKGETVKAEEGHKIIIHTSYEHWGVRGLSSNDHYIEISDNEYINELVQQALESKSECAQLKNEIIELTRLAEIGSMAEWLVKRGGGHISCNYLPEHMKAYREEANHE